MPEYIKQTNRTILFEEFSRCDDVPRLDILLSNNTQLSHIKVKQELTVTSFEEFIKKFDPKYYEYTELVKDTVTGEEYPVFTYSLKPPARENAVPRRLVDQPFYKAMMNISIEKGNSGKTDFGFDFESELSKAYSPKKTMDDARDIRAKLAYNWSEYKKIEKKGGSQAEKDEYASEIKRLRKRIRDDYMSQSQFDLIPLFIEDTKERIERIGYKSGEDSGDEKRRARVQITFGSDGSPKYIEMKNNDDNDDTKLIGTSADSSTKMLETILSNDFDQAANKGKNLLVVDDPKSTEFMKNMLLSVFAGKSFEDDDSTSEQLKANLNMYELMYKASQQSFAQNVVSLVEKIINIRTFFEHSGDNTELIVSNCQIQNLLGNVQFERFIQAEGQESSDERIWFAIIPAVNHNDFVKLEGLTPSSNPKDDLDDLDDIDDTETESTTAISLTNFSNLTTALKIFGENDIITFFNFKGCNKTSSTGLTKQVVIDYKKEFDSISGEKYGEYAIFCYPNFTVLPDRESSVKIGNEFIKLPPVFIDASYVAAGLVVKSQKLDELSCKGFEVNNSLGQPIRFDFEASFDTKYGDKKVPLSQVYSTSMSRELVLSWTPDLVEEIRKDGGFGFCFCGDEKWYDYRGRTTKQNNAYAFKSRTLAKDKVKDEDGKPTGETRYRPIFKTLVNTYFKKLAKKTNAQQIARLCEDYMRGLNKKCINNALYNPDFSSVKCDETITMSGNNVKIKYDKDRDDFTLNFEEA